MAPDANEVALNAHLNEIDKADRIEEAIENEAQLLLAVDYSPYDPKNLSEAIGELSAIDFLLLANYLREGLYKHAGNHIDREVCAYWIRAARRKAEVNCDGEFDGS